MNQASSPDPQSNTDAQSMPPASNTSGTNGISERTELRQSDSATESDSSPLSTVELEPLDLTNPQNEASAESNPADQQQTSTTRQWSLSTKVAASAIALSAVPL
ncbi:MAG TPA: hypothetical protein V6D19_15090, partial [Stenomitos sp.]